MIPDAERAVMRDVLLPAATLLDPGCPVGPLRVGEWVKSNGETESLNGDKEVMKVFTC